MELAHGGDWMSYREQYGKDALDFSANVSPLGLPQGVARAITQALAQADRYPDPLCRTLCAAIAEREGVPREDVLCGNGAADLIFRFVWAEKPRRALVVAPTFAEYEAALKTVGCEVRRYLLHEENDFALTEDFLRAIDADTDALFLCQPNNPTGMLTEPTLLQKILERCQACGVRLVLDECFLDFLPEHERLTAKPMLTAQPNLLILKAFTKLYGMAGVRLGYALSADTALLARMRAAGQPWAVSSLAQAAGVAALHETEYVARLRELIERERPRLESGLRELGLRVVPGRANYLLFRAPATLGGALKEKGIILRCCDNYLGLGAEWYRAAVRTEAENTRLLEALREVL